MSTWSDHAAREREKAKESAAPIVQDHICDDACMRALAADHPFGYLDDGFGGYWPRCKADCPLEIVRPGKVQCGDCSYDPPETPDSASPSQEKV